MKTQALFYIISFAYMVFGLTAISQNYVVAILIVKSGDYQRMNTPVSINLDQLGIDDFSNLILVEISENQRINTPLQIESNKNSLWWTLSGLTESESTRTYELIKGSTGSGIENEIMGLDGMVDVLKDENGLKIKTEGKNLLQYNSIPVTLPNGVDSAYTRGAFIHPLCSPSGQVLTQIQPEDHYHHVGIWNPWTKANFEGREVDFWNLVKKQGTVRFKELSATEEGPVFGGFSVLQEHIDLTSPEGEKVAINEEWEIRVYHPDENSENLYFVDFISKLQCASSSPVILEKYRYGGGIGFRATELWTKENCNVLSSEGKTRVDGDATRARWCNVFGTIGKQQSGILFMCDPKNFSFPQPMRIWPEDAIDGKGYMYFQFCPIREDAWNLYPGKLYFQKYRMIVYDGEITNELLWQDYANPPEIIIH